MRISDWSSDVCSSDLLLTFHRQIERRRDVERQQLRGQQTTDDGNAERLARFGTGAEAERDRQRAENRRERGHHDRPETYRAGLEARSVRGHTLTPSRDRDVEQEDAVLFMVGIASCRERVGQSV